MRLRYLLAVCLAILCLVQSACAPRGPRPEVAHPAIPADLVLVRSINAQTAESAHMESASLNISDPKNLAGQFEERLERMLVERQFTLTDQPSLAERIISLKILYKGEAGRADMERVVKAGYDMPVPELFGEGGVLVADLFLMGQVAQRQVADKGGGTLKDILRVWEAGQDIGHSRLLQGVGEGIEIGIVVVKGGFVDHGPLTELFDGDFLQRLLGPQRQKGLGDAPPGLFDAQIHISASFQTFSEKGWLTYAR